MRRAGKEAKQMIQMMKIKKRILTLALAAMMLTGNACLAEDMQFVDASGTTGYYVDVDSISYATVRQWVQPDPVPSDDPEKPDYLPPGYEQECEVVTARVAVIKARQNRRYLYDMRFDPTMSTYQILSSKIQQYDTREIVHSANIAMPVMAYTKSSPMKQVVDFIYAQPRKQENR